MPYACEHALKKDWEVNKIGVLEKFLDNKRASPTFIIPKKNRIVCFVTDLR